MTTPRDLIKGALGDIGAIGPGESIPAEDVTDLYNRANRMISAWSNDSALIFADTLVSYALTSGDGEYTIGSGGDINTTRPTKIKTAYVTNGVNDYSLRIIDEYKFSKIHNKTLQTTYPCYLYYRTGYPLGTIHLQGLPTSGFTLKMDVEIPLTEFTSLTQTLSLPPGYEEAIQHNLAIRYAPTYEKAVPMDIKELARDGLDMIKQANRRNNFYEAELNAPGTGRGYYDINTGGYV